MHLDILNKEQKQLLHFISLFKREYYLVGDTAIALQIGHWQSIDFDLFKEKKINKNNIFNKIKIAKVSYQTTLSQNGKIMLIYIF